MSRRPRLLAALAATTTALLALTACAGDAGGAPPPAESGENHTRTVRLPDPTGYTSLPLLFAEQNGLFEEEGLEVEWVQTDDLVTSTGAGDLTIAFGPTTTYLRAAANGAPIRLVGAGFRTKGPFWLIADTSITSVEELSGKTVGIAVPGSGLETYTKAILEAHGVNPDEVELVANGTNETAYGSITTGQVDASIIHQPFGVLGEHEGTTRTLARGWDYLPTYQTGAVIAGTKALENDPELVEAALNIYYRAYSYAKENYDTYLPWLKEQLPAIPDEVIEQAIELEDVIWENNAALDLDALNESQRIEIELGNQSEVFDVEQYVDLNLIPQQYVLDFVYPDPKTASGE